MENKELLLALETHLYSMALSNFNKNKVDPITAYLVMESISKKFLEQANRKILLSHMSIGQPEESKEEEGSAEDLKKALKNVKEANHDNQVSTA